MAFLRRFMQISKRDQRPGKLWLPSLLLLAQFLTIAPVLLIVFANEQQRRASDEYLKLLDGLERLSFEISEWETRSRFATPSRVLRNAWR